MGYIYISPYTNQKSNYPLQGRMWCVCVLYIYIYVCVCVCVCVCARVHLVGIFEELKMGNRGPFEFSLNQNLPL